MQTIFLVNGRHSSMWLSIAIEIRCRARELKQVKPLLKALAPASGSLRDPLESIAATTVVQLSMLKFGLLKNAGFALPGISGGLRTSKQPSKRAQAMLAILPQEFLSSSLIAICLRRSFMKSNLQFRRRYMTSFLGAKVDGMSAMQAHPLDPSTTHERFY